MMAAITNYQAIVLNPQILGAVVFLPIIFWISSLIAPPPKHIEFAPIFILKRIKAVPPSVQKPPIWLVVIRVLSLLFLILAIADFRIVPKSALGENIKNIEIFIEDTFVQNQNFAERIKPLVTFLEANPSAKASVYFINESKSSLINANNIDAIKTLSTANMSAGENNYGDVIKANYPTQKSTVFYISDGIKNPGQAEFNKFLSQRTKGTIRQLPNPNAKLILDLRIVENTAQIAIFNPSKEKTLINAFSSDGNIIGSTIISNSSGIINLPAQTRPAYFAIKDQNHAGGVFLTNYFGAKPLIGIVSENVQSAELNSDSHFIKAAAALENPIIVGELSNIVSKSPDIIVLGDRPGFSPSEINELKTFAKKGGTIIRFLGPKSLANPNDEILTGIIKSPEHNLFGQINPTPINIMPFEKGTIFEGLQIPADAKIEKSILFEKANTNTKVLAKLSDGAPLISEMPYFEGKLYVIHTSASPLWSNLGIGPLQFEILGRIFNAVSLKNYEVKQDSGGKVLLLHGIENDGKIKSLNPPKQIDEMPAKANNVNPPGIYWNNQNTALNITNNRVFEPATYPNQFQTFADIKASFRFHGLFLGLSLFLLIFENIVRLSKGFKIRFAPRTSIVFALICILFAPLAAKAEGKKDSIKLSYLVTGDIKTDTKASVALKGLAKTLENRTNIEPSGVIGLNADAPEILKQPILYWLLPPNSKSLNAKEVDNLNKFMRNGGVIFIDTQGKGQIQAQAQANLRRALNGLVIPQLETVPENHVLRKSFYVLQGFPGFYQNAEIWVETAKSAGTNSFDGVSPIIIGDGDWASIWALAANYSISPFDYPKEVPLRVGVNIFLYALTGQYKNDQLHIDAILKRLSKGAKP